MKQTQEMIKAKAKKFDKSKCRNFKREHTHPYTYEGIEDGFVLGYEAAMAEFMQAQQEESEAGENVPLKFVMWYSGMAEDKIRKQLARWGAEEIPAPVIESPPREGFINFCKECTCQDKCYGLGECVLAQPTPASVEEKGEGETHDCPNYAKINCRCPEGVCNYIPEDAAKIIQDLRNQIKELSTPAPPSVKEEDAEGEWKYDVINTALGDTGDYMTGIEITNGKTFLHSDDDIDENELQEICDKLNAARDYKSAKGMDNENK